MNQTIDISDFGQILSSLKGQSQSKKASGTGNNLQDEFKSILKGLSGGKKVLTNKVNSNTDDASGVNEEIACCGKDIIENLKNALISKGITGFETTRIDMESLSKIEKLLLKSGADPDKVSSLMSSLKSKMTNGGISLKEVFAGLNTLEETDFYESDFFLEISSQPYLQTLLTQMGLDESAVKSMIESSTDGERGINIGKLVKALKSMEDSKFKSAALFSDDSKGAVNAADILEQIGLKIQDNDRNGRMSLGRLIAILENNASVAAASNSAIKEAFSKAVESVKSVSSPTDPATSSRAMLAKMQLKDEEKTASDPQKVKNDKQAGQKIQKSGNDVYHNQAQPERAESVIKVEFQSALAETEKKSERSLGGKKHEDSLEMAARIFDIVSGREAIASDVQESTQNQRPLPAYVANQAAKGIVKAINANEKEVVINIKPPELGRMQIKIESTEAGVKVQIIAEKNMASDILNSNKNDLTAYLAENGIRVDRIDVQLASNFDQTMASFREQAHQDNGKRKNRKNEGSGQDDAGGRTPAENSNDSDDRVSLTA